MAQTEEQLRKLEAGEDMDGETVSGDIYGEPDEEAYEELDEDTDGETDEETDEDR